MKTYVKDLKENMQVTDLFLLKAITVQTAKNGKEYHAVTLQDKTGTVEGKAWSTDVFQGIPQGSVVFITAKTNVFNGMLQVIVSSAAAADRYEESDFYPTSPYDIESMYHELTRLIGTVENPYLNQLLILAYNDNEEASLRIRNHSAACSLHHAFIGGFLQHTLFVTQLCHTYAVQYPSLNRDLLITAALLHDYGKLWEISPFPENTYTEEGNLLGHIYLGTEKVSEYAAEIAGFPPMLLLQLKHCILAHHGQLDFGSPVTPKLAEACALNQADMADSRLEMFSEATQDLPLGEWTKHRVLGRVRGTLI